MCVGSGTARIVDEAAESGALERVDLAIAEALSTIDEIRATLDAATAQIDRGLEILADGTPPMSCGS
ncbi:hypothetical protein [Methylobacterium isbiliense]|jgi:hypothetical protein|uniref:Uncharacterized protein n=1 Tax=Methylobacterium isbiliense TaxID=315478 RepID=A0ABQ4SB90_9HYPH|nr:hypothetical protein [Methylobacterium isbiliense]MDN3623558.1 hypothetical protein [Methylobacterium isbiliense]GJD99778.1 hypothetical protein GMJLKIPL_1696 [Methylobacterium isbiliense]